MTERVIEENLVVQSLIGAYQKHSQEGLLPYEGAG